MLTAMLYRQAHRWAWVLHGSAQASGPPHIDVPCGERMLHQGCGQYVPGGKELPLHQVGSMLDLGPWGSLDLSGPWHLDREATRVVRRHRWATEAYRPGRARKGQVGVTVEGTIVR